jgi:Carboxypeptidase regulatory-like domain
MAFGLVSRRSARRVILAILIVAPISGCGRSGRATVSGILLRAGGAPLVGARVIATSKESGNSAYGTTDDHGHFELGLAEKGDGIPAGNYDVTIVEERGDPDNRRPPTIAAKYRDAGSSGIRVSVKSGESAKLNLTLEPP